MKTYTYEYSNTEGEAKSETITAKTTNTAKASASKKSGFSGGKWQPPVLHKGKITFIKKIKKTRSRMGQHLMLKLLS